MFGRDTWCMWRSRRADWPSAFAMEAGRLAGLQDRTAAQGPWGRGRDARGRETAAVNDVTGTNG